MNKDLHPIELSIVIVNYNTKDLLNECIASIYDGTLNNFEIIVADNDSHDDSKGLITNNFPEVIWFNTEYDAGYARANNLGIKRARGNYILVLSPDTVILRDAIAKTLEFYKKEEEQCTNLGLVSCKMLNSDGSLQFSSFQQFLDIGNVIKTSPFYIFFRKQEHNTKDEERIKMMESKHKNTHETSWLTGAFLLFNSKMCKEDGIWLDDDFFMYYEEVEWCYRIQKTAYRNVYFSEAEITHYGGVTWDILEQKTAQIQISEWLYILKTKGRGYYLSYLMILTSNLFLDSLFYAKNKLFNKIEEDDLSAKQDRSLTVDLLKRYGWRIFSQYKQKPSSGKRFLHFAQ